MNFAERGVGLNRNNALMRADGDIVLFADDDMVYTDGYDKLLIDAFEYNPKADVICFNLKEENSSRKQIQAKHIVKWWNYLTYGTARFAVKLSSVKLNGIYFNQCFGGETEHCQGEDNLFLTECLKLKFCRKADCYLLNENLSLYRRGRKGSISNHETRELIIWHYKLFREAEGKGKIMSTVCTVRNLIFGAYKKMKYVYKKSFGN